MNAIARDETARAALEGGDQEAFAELVAAHGSAVFAVAYSITGDRAASEDLAQEAFLAAWRGRRELRDPAHFRAWVCGIARNLGRNEIRRRARSEALAERFEREQPAAAPAPVAASIERETEALLWSALRDLPERHREVLTLYYREGRSAAQVASALGISEALVCKRLERARAALRDEAHRRIEDGLARLEPPRDFRRRVLAALPLGAAARPGLPGAAAAGSAPSPLTLGAFIVSNTGKVAAGIAACALALGLAWRGAGGDESEASAAADPAATASNTAAAPAAAEPSTRPASTARRPDAPTLPVRETDERGKNAEHEGHELLSLAIDGDDGTLWYKLMPALHCDRELSLGRDIATDPVELTFSFGPGPGGARLRAVTVRDPEGALKGTDAYERCVLARLANQVFPAGTTAASARVTTTEQAPPPEPLDAPLESMFSGPSRGPADARVRILVYTDFQCPFCSKALVTIDQIREEYPEDVRIITKLHPLKPSSRRLAEATVAAGEQGKFWEMHDLIFAYQDQGAIDDALLASFAEQLGLDLERFRADLDSDTIRGMVDADLAEGRALGVRGTPAFFVNEHSVVGAQPIDVFRELVERELAEPAK